MANKKIAELIANGLRDGMMHPGREQGDPIPVLLPFFRTTGMPPEMADVVTETAMLLSEAIVALIETDHRVVEKGELEELHVAKAAAPSRHVPVYSKADKRRTKPLFVLTVTNSPYVMIDEKQLMKGLNAR